MNYERLKQYRQVANLHSAVLVLSLAGLLAAVGYLLGGKPFALGAALGVGLLYLLNPRVAPWLLLKSFKARPLSGLLHLALSRAREYGADMSAAELLGSPGPLADALYRLDRHNRSIWHRLPWMLAPRREPRSWLSTHPPTEERIRRLMHTAPRPSRPIFALNWRNGY
jgi:Zn-dependent protease with chaperone function